MAQKTAAVISALDMFDDCLPIYAFEKNINGQYLYASPAFCRALGLTAETVVGKTDGDIFSIPVVEQHAGEEKRLLTGEVSKITAEVNLNPAGQALWVSFNKIPLKNEQGDIIGILALGTDVSDRKELEKRLASEHNLLRAVIDNIPDQVFAHDLDCRFLLNNKRDAWVMGVSDPESLLGKSDKDFYKPEIAANFQADDRAVMQKNESINIVQELSITRDGRQLWLNTVKTPFHDENGKVIGLVGYARDVTDRKMAEEDLMDALRENQNSLDFLQNILDTSPTYVCWKDRSSRFLGCNLAYARLVGFSGPQDIIGKTDWDLPWTSGQTEHYIQDDQRVMEGGQPEYHIIENGRDAEGNQVWFDTNKMPLRNADGEVIGILVNIQDITIQKLALDDVKKLNTELEQRVEQRTAQLQASNRELESFSYSVSHDLRAPLRRINGYGQILLEEYGPNLDDTGRNYLSRILTSSKYMGKLIESLLNLSRFSRIDPRIGPVDLCVLAREILANYQALNPERTVEIDLPQTLVVNADEDLMQIVLDNLLGNAWKFTSKKDSARIKMDSCQRDNKTVVFISDNGAGFDMAFVNKLFLTFSRLHTDKEFGGTGIGLALVQRIIQRHGGDIWAEGQVDQGATFYFTLG